MQFTIMIEELAQLLNTEITLPEFYDAVLEKTGYATMLEMKPIIRALRKADKKNIKGGYEAIYW